MSIESPPLPFQSLKRWVGLARQEVFITLFIALAAAVVIWLVLQVANNMSVLRSSPQDNVQWSLAQLDVELLAVEIAAREVKSNDAASLAKLRQRFDVFYSRAKTTATMPIFRNESGSTDARAILNTIQDRLNEMTPIVDLPDAALFVRADEISTKLGELRPLARQVTLRSLKIHAANSDRTRGEFATLLVRTGLFNAFLVFALGATLLFLMRQMKISSRRADALQVSSDRNASTLLASLDAIIVIDMAGRIVEFNPAAATTFGYSRNAAMGAKLDELIVPERYREAHQAGFERFRKTGAHHVIGAGRIEMAALRADGSEFPVEFSLGTTQSPEGKLVIAYLRDISSRVEQDQQLRSARDEAVEAAQAKSQFLAVMSHEMRTPLNGVMAILDLLEATPLSKKQQKYIDTALMSADVLKQHVDDVLDLTRIQAGKFELFPRSFNLVDLLEEVQVINVATAARGGNRIVLDVDLPKPYFVADRKRIHQILTNLVGNAIKFTQDGLIEIHAKCVEVKSDVVMFEFSVRDTGIGIAEDYQSKIFDDFVTLDGSYQRNAAGAGLGLSICRNIVEAMGGSIGVHSKLGEGQPSGFAFP
jgi:PAS domain S-box-containing protein